ncbi:MAG: hypothetical protein ACMUIP_11965 [bacterium]
MLENREISVVPIYMVGRSGKVCGRNPDMYATEKSDIGVVPKKVPNKTGLPVVEVLEERPVPKGNFVKADCDLHAAAGRNIERT